MDTLHTTCVEIWVSMSPERRMEYALADRRSQFRIAAENPIKSIHLRTLLDQHPDGRVLVIGEYLDQVGTSPRRSRRPS